MVERLLFESTGRRPTDEDVKAVTEIHRGLKSRVADLYRVVAATDSEPAQVFDPAPRDEWWKV